MTAKPDPQLAAEIEAALALLEAEIALLEAEIAVWRAQEHLARLIEQRRV